VTTLQLYAAAIARKRELEAALDAATAECRRLARQINHERTTAAEAAMKGRKNG
jgi:hypothetical protein